MNELRTLYAKLQSLPPPKGFARSTEDLDVLVHQYADTVAGLASSYLAGAKVAYAAVNFDPELDRRLEECRAKLEELRLYKQKHDALAKILIETLSNDASS